MTKPLDDAALNQLFLEARTHNAWQSKPVPEDVLRRLVDMLKMGPTSANCLPARFVFVASAEGKAKLAPHLSGNNREKTMHAPVCAIIGYDLDFHEHLPRLFPQADAKAWFTGNAEKVRETAVRNGTLQGAYLILAARALGLDAGPMSGFDRAGVTTAFFDGTCIEANFLCNLGYGDPTRVFERLPRFSFDEMAQIV